MSKLKAQNHDYQQNLHRVPGTLAHAHLVRKQEIQVLSYQLLKLCVFINPLRVVHFHGLVVKKY